MNKIYFALLFVFFLANHCFAQNNLRSGFIVTNSDDTIYGKIEYNGIRNNSRKCIFTRDDNKDKYEYFPVHIQAYRYLEGRYYVSKRIYLADRLTPDSIGLVVFLEKVVSGEINLYYYLNDKGDHYFIQKNNGPLYELLNESREVTVKGTRYIEESRGYIPLLKKFFRDCPVDSDAITNLIFSRASLIKLVESYYDAQCTTEQYEVFDKNTHKLHIGFGPVIGINTYKMSYLPDLFSSAFADFGLFIEVNLPAINEGLSLHYEIGYNQWRLKNKTSEFSEISYDLQSLKNTLLLKYKFINHKIGPVVEAGIYMDNILSYSYDEKEYSIDPAGIKTLLNKDFKYSFSNLDYGAVGGLGVLYKISQINEIYLDVRYQMGVGFDETIYFDNITQQYSNNRTRNISLHLSYSF